MSNLLSFGIFLTSFSFPLGLITAAAKHQLLWHDVPEKIEGVGMIRECTSFQVTTFTHQARMKSCQPHQHTGHSTLLRSCPIEEMCMSFNFNSSRQTPSPPSHPTKFHLTQSLYCSTAILNQFSYH
jgi:hypothetical protein